MFDRLNGVRVVFPQAPKRRSKWYGYNTPLWFQFKVGTLVERFDIEPFPDFSAK
jgi:hypothetical protein